MTTRIGHSEVVYYQSTGKYIYRYFWTIVKLFIA